MSAHTAKRTLWFNFSATRVLLEVLISFLQTKILSRKLVLEYQKENDVSCSKDLSLTILFQPRVDFGDSLNSEKLRTDNIHFKIIRANKVFLYFCCK